MVISGLEKELGATYQAKRIEDDQVVFGIGVIKVDEEKTYLIQMFQTNDSVDGSPAFAYYIPVKTNSIVSFNSFDVQLNNDNNVKMKKLNN